MNNKTKKIILITVLGWGLVVISIGILITINFNYPKYKITKELCHNEKCVVAYMESNLTDDEVKDLYLDISISSTCPKCYIPFSCGMIQAEELTYNLSFDKAERVWYKNKTNCEEVEVDEVILGNSYCFAHSPSKEHALLNCINVVPKQDLTKEWLYSNCECQRYCFKDVCENIDERGFWRKIPFDAECSKYKCGEYTVVVK